MNNNRLFQIFTKPVGDRCNLSCSYCYYHTDLPEKPNGNFFSNDDLLLEEYVRQHIEATTDETVFFSWHGGEPTLAGIQFYEKVLRFQRRYLPAGKKLLNGIQTNGTILDDNWCRFLASEKFIIGVSIDGPEYLHNQYRIDNKGQKTFERVLKGYHLLQKYNVPTEILCVVSAANQKYPLEVYRFFKELDARFITFLPLVERTGIDAEASERSVDPIIFGRFLIAIFDEWKQNDVGNIQVQIFEEALRSAFDDEHSLCIFKKVCGGVPVIEKNGNFYSCDHFVNGENWVGNIRQKSISAMLDSEKQLAFGRIKSETLPEYCRQCEVLSMCNGECPKNRFVLSPAGEPGLNYLCAGYKAFFNHCRSLIDEIRKIAAV